MSLSAEMEYLATGTFGNTYDEFMHWLCDMVSNAYDCLADSLYDDKKRFLREFTKLRLRHRNGELQGAREYDVAFAQIKIDGHHRMRLRVLGQMDALGGLRLASYILPLNISRLSLYVWLKCGIK